MGTLIVIVKTPLAVYVVDSSLRKLVYYCIYAIIYYYYSFSNIKRRYIGNPKINDKYDRVSLEH